jgi:hypothetical protein
MDYETEIKCTYFVLYRVLGDSGVPDRGVFIKEFTDERDLKHFIEHLGSMCDDRCNTEILYINPSFDILRQIDDDRL